MLLQRIFSTAAVAVSLCLLPQLSQAQLVNDPAQAAAARDSVLARANDYHQRIEQRAKVFSVRVHRLGKRRRVVRGYYVQGSTVGPSVRKRAWKHVTRTLATGVVRERYLGYVEGEKVLEETRTNHQTTYVRVHRLVKASNVNFIIGRAPLGYCTSEGYVKWGREQYILTQPTRF
ncbi:hypothetical protein EJV47_18705 [Hymenobacter gummosus]|uniref:Uncharacterized protein n=1 Tax=Hymenobacter gummosus TaxID=1776032 RepID=A0A3S0H2Z8_9BACT|nr:hypothetical protein [Hymenobacter gummosus]RTQ47457.1 hypothetical protein EJV47_18705 [Hymenobacter gummosus]